jgi:hypothetical protein
MNLLQISGIEGERIGIYRKQHWLKLKLIEANWWEQRAVCSCRNLYNMLQ